jgi:hypothetical protein
VNESWQKYLLGVAVAALLALYGTTCVLQARVCVPGLLHLPGGLALTIDELVIGSEAVCIGIACLGAAGYLFARFYLENTVQSTKGQNVTYLLQVCALVVLVAGVGLAFWFELFV